MGHPSRRFVRSAGLGLCCLLAASAPAAAADPIPPKLEDQFNGETSRLVGENGGVTDRHLAISLRKALTVDGKGLGPDILDATFLFNSCFGGGMLDDILELMPRGLRWVGGSASNYGQRAVGTITPAEAVGRTTPPAYVEASPSSFWTRALVSELGSQSNVLSALAAVEQTDKVGPNAKTADGYHFLEQPQWAYANGGEEIVLADPQATSRYAVLWAGNATKGMKRHHENLIAMRSLLVQKWGLTEETDRIQVFSGVANGPAPGGGSFDPEWHVRPGNAEGLRIFLGKLFPTLDAQTQFLFYATGHGDATRKFPQPDLNIEHGTSESDEVSLTSEDLALVAQQQQEDDSLPPSLVVEYDGYFPTLGEVSVRLNGTLLGTLDPIEPPSMTLVAAADEEPEPSLQEFIFSSSLLGTTNTVELINNSDSALHLVEMNLAFGGVSDTPTIPEPCVGVLLLAVLLPHRRHRVNPGRKAVVQCSSGGDV